MNTEPDSTEALIHEIARYLAAVDVFRAEACEPIWLAEPAGTARRRERRASRQRPGSCDALSTSPRRPTRGDTPWPLDGSAAGAVVGPPGSGVPAASIQRIEGKEWSVFGGRWGESEYFFTPIPLGPLPAGAVPIGLAPASPANQQNWLAETVLGWPVAP